MLRVLCSVVLVTLVACRSSVAEHSPTSRLERGASSPHGSIAIALPNPQPWPSVACTSAELERLRAAYQGKGAAHGVVAERVARADERLAQEIVFPPDGGQHNQWYQCETCQYRLETVHDTQHRCPLCGKVYSGYPYDNVVFERQHYRLTKAMEDCAWVYALTAQIEFAQYARDILVGYAERYRQYPYHSSNQGKRSDPPSRSGGHVFEQTLNEAEWAEPICKTYDLIRQSDAVSTADHQAIREGLLLPLVHNIAKHRAGKSNWQTYHNSAYMLIGGVLNDVSLIQRALDDPENGFYYQMWASVLPEGMWYENSWGYHFYTLGAVELIVETARRLGIDLYDTPKVRKMYQVAMDYVMPDGSLPRFGDSTSRGFPGKRYEAAYAHWRDALFLAVLPEYPTWKSILYGRTAQPRHTKRQRSSSLQEGAGHAILRATGAEGSSSAIMTFGPFGGFHGHFDKLSFVYSALDREQAHDPGRARSQAEDRLQVVGDELALAAVDSQSVTTQSNESRRASDRTELSATSGAPYPASSAITGIEWAPRSSIVRLAEGSDNWPMTWADDGHLYSAYGDGWGFEPMVEKKLSLGLVRVEGNVPVVRGVNIRSKDAEQVGQGADGIKASGMLMLDGVLYMLVRNAENAQLLWSEDHGKSWKWADWKWTTSFGCPTFLNYGKNYSQARDDSVYIYSHDHDSAYEPADRMVMARVPKGKIRERDGYEFFRQLGADEKPIWTRTIHDRGAVFVNSGSCYRSGITYNAGLKRYLWCQTLPQSKHSRGPRFQGGLGIYEAPEPWGPWKTVYYTEDWDVGPGETSSFPTKWMSEDGKTIHLVFSGDDHFSVRKATLLTE